jgi:hypothetical protein
MQPTPDWSTLEMILTNVRGGALERVDFHDHQRFTCVRPLFIPAEQAMKFIICKAQGQGVYWVGSGIISKVEGPYSMFPLSSFFINVNLSVAIPSSKGSHEPIKSNVSKGIRAGATRCLRIPNLPNNVGIELLTSQVKDQSSHISAESQSLRLVPEVATLKPSVTAFSLHTQGMRFTAT